MEPWCFVELDWSLRVGTASIIALMIDGSKRLWNVGIILRDYTAPRPKRLSFSYTPLWEPDISQILRFILDRAWFRPLVAGLSPRKPGFALGSLRVGSVVYKVALGQVTLRVLRFSCWQYHSAVALYTHISPGGWAIGLLVAAVQRHFHPIGMNNKMDLGNILERSSFESESKYRVPNKISLPSISSKYCNKFAGSISQWKFITLQAQYTTVEYSSQHF
jgi:hypothetical protein